jgi:hypothetical protein
LQNQALENQSLGGRNLRNEQGERNAASELCTAKQVEIVRYSAKSGALPLTLAGEVLSSPQIQVPSEGVRCPRRLRRALVAQVHPSTSLSDGISS